MFYFTIQEKCALLFLAVSIFCGSFFLLMKKQYPPFAEFFYSPIEQIIQQKINIHSATQEEWESLPAIGVYRAKRIVEARTQRGGFRSIDDVRYVKGIGPYVFNQIKPYLCDD